MKTSEGVVARVKCPVCDGDMYARGFRWECRTPVCGFSCGRAYKKDPLGNNIGLFPDRRMMRLRMHYRLTQGLPFEKIDVEFGDIIYCKVVVRCSGSEATPRCAVETYSDRDGKLPWLHTSWFKNCEDALTQAREWVAVQKGEKESELVVI